MEEIKKLEERINHIEYRLGILKKFLDSDGVIKTYKGEKININLIRTEVMNDMKREIKSQQIKSNKDHGLKFYHKNSKQIKFKFA